MKIGIDARLINETGVGRYIRNLIEQLGHVDDKNEYVVFLTSEAFDSFVLPNTRWQKRLADVRWHTIREQFMMPTLFLREKLDLVHIPYFNVPILYPKAFVVTIHDLTILHFNTGRATMLPWGLYQLRRAGYWLVHTFGLRNAKKILTVSQATKQEIIDHFQINPNKIIVMYEGVDSKISNFKFQISNKKPIITEPYFLYVGNAYPHKNLEILVKAFQKLTSDNLHVTVKLVLVGKEDYFYRRLKQLISHNNLSDRVIFFGEADDKQLANLYTHARALVFPSRMEGFGLPAIEALALGCRVIASDIPAFREILGDNAAFFPVGDARALTKLLIEAVHGNLVKPETKKITSLLSTFQWPSLARATLNIYESCTRL